MITRIRAKHTEIKRVLLDQTVISGVGNIYADESLAGDCTAPVSPTASVAPNSPNSSTPSPTAMRGHRRRRNLLR